MGERVREKEIKGDRERHRKNVRKLRDRFPIKRP